MKILLPGILVCTILLNPIAHAEPSESSNELTCYQRAIKKYGVKEVDKDDFTNGSCPDWVDGEDKKEPPVNEPDNEE